VSAGEPAALDIVLEPRGQRLAERLRDGELEARVEFLYYKDHRRTHVGEGTIARDGRLLTFDRVTFPADGKYHVRLTLLHDGERLGEAQFDICVGVDPQGDPAEVAAVCPEMNPVTSADLR
jgi:hypothetical protein